MSTYVQFIPSGEIVSILKSSLPISQEEYSPNTLQSDNTDINIDTHYVENNEVKQYTKEELVKKQNPPKYNAIWDIATKSWIDNRQGLTLKNDKLLEVNLEREQRNLKPIEYENTLYDADEKSQSNLRGWVNVLSSGGTLPENFTWRDYNDVNHLVDFVWILGLHTAIINRTTALYQRSWELKSEIEQITDTETLRNFSTGDYTSTGEPNWPGVPPK